MSGRSLLIIGGGILQERTFGECVKQGLETILVDADAGCYCRDKADYFIEASTKKPYTVLEKIRVFLKNNPNIKLEGVYTQGCDVEHTVAYVASHLNLPSIGIAQASACNNKIAMRMIFKDHGIPQPDFSVDSIGDLKFPIVCKPVDNCASRGITIIHTKEELPQAIERALGSSIDRHVLFEEFIDGKEYSVDTILYQGRLYPCGISDRIFEHKGAYAVQNGSITPSTLLPEKQEEIYGVMERCAEAIGVQWGAFKGDIIIDNDGRVYILEVTARLSGGFDAQYRKPYSFGVNLIKATIDLAVGNPLDFMDIIPRWMKYSQTFSIFPKPGIIKEIAGIGETKSIPGVKRVFITKKAGDEVKPYTHCADRICYIISCADSREDLNRIKNTVEETLEFITHG